MGRVDLNVKDDLEKRFRDMVYQSKGMKKGNLTDALQEAMELWIEEEATQLSKKKVVKS